MTVPSRCLALWLLAALLAAQTAAPAPAPSVRALLERARRHSEHGETAAALETLRQARSIAPNSETVLRASAEASLAAGALLPAIRHLEALTRLYPTVAEYRTLEGTALLRAGDPAAAVEPLAEADRLEPRMPATLVALGRALSGGTRYEEARSCLLRALSLAPDSTEALAALAEAEEALGELDEAEAHARRALARETAQPLASLVIGMVRMRQERYAEARDALEKAVAADPDSARARYQLSLACARLEDAAGAQEQLRVYRRKTRERDELVSAERALTGFSPGGTQR